MSLTDTNPSIGAKNYWAAAAKWPWWQQWLVATGIALILYIPIVGNTFVSDDWLVLKRLTLEERLNTRGFFRPLSDITIWLNYQLGGLNALNYYLFGIILRGLSAVLLYRFCLRWHWKEGDDKKYIFSGIAALLFITYPFHNEPVAWILGRGALMAGIMAMAAMVILTSRLKHPLKIAGICICYFVGLLAYESIFILPMLVLVYMFATNKSYALPGLYFCFLALTLGLHLFLRFEISGTLLGSYGEGFVGEGKTGLFIYNGLKAMVRNFVPPQNNPNLFISFAVFLLLAWLALKGLLQRTLRGNNRPKVLYFCIVGYWLFSLWLACVGGVSTRTSESDRFLELPSYFICMIIAFFMVYLIRTKRSLIVTLFIIIAFNIFFLEKNNFNWVKASDAVKETLQIAKTSTEEQGVYFYNMPEEIDGAYIFRVGFEDAMLLNGIDTAKVKLLVPGENIILPPGLVYNWNGQHWELVK